MSNINIQGGLWLPLIPPPFRHPCRLVKISSSLPIAKCLSNELFRVAVLTLNMRCQFSAMFHEPNEFFVFGVVLQSGALLCRNVGAVD